MKFGMVVVAGFSGAVGIKRRPMLVVSTDLYHAERPDVILIVITSQTKKANAKTDYVLQDWAVAGLRQPSAVRVYFGMKTPAELTVIGELSERDRLAVQKILRIALDV